MTRAGKAATKLALCASWDTLVGALIDKIFECPPSPAELQKATEKEILEALEEHETIGNLIECGNTATVDVLATVLEMVGQEDAAKVLELTDKVLMLAVEIARNPNEAGYTLVKTEYSGALKFIVCGKL